MIRCNPCKAPGSVSDTYSNTNVSVHQLMVINNYSVFSRLDLHYIVLQTVASNLNGNLQIHKATPSTLFLIT